MSVPCGTAIRPVEAAVLRPLAPAQIRPASGPPVRAPPRPSPAQAPPAAGPQRTSQFGDAMPMLQTSSCTSSTLAYIMPRGCPRAHTSCSEAAGGGVCVASEAGGGGLLAEWSLGPRGSRVGGWGVAKRHKASKLYESSKRTHRQAFVLDPAVGAPPATLTLVSHHRRGADGAGALRLGGAARQRLGPDHHQRARPRQLGLRGAAVVAGTHLRRGRGAAWLLAPASLLLDVKGRLSLGWLVERCPPPNPKGFQSASQQMRSI